jgi:Tol biopolymer transport system component/tRNA A-37 threonylcarbamoyl transferase component Bud32
MDAPRLLNDALKGRYSVEREIGRGGMASVYLAHDIKHDRKVALKLLNPELGAVLGVERFLSEIRVTANLQHPNLLPLFDSGEVSGQLFYVMPYVEGESLRARLDREKQLPIDEAVRIALGIANALDYAHARDVIHRDLKPENILLQHGEPVIADFGIALAVSRAGGARVTQTGLSLGTPQYMSPEQATGDRAIDGRSDIYSLGACLYEMIGGEAPHTGSTGQAIIAKLMTEEPRRLEMLRRAVPAHIADAVHHALEKLPADRWKSAKEFAEALRGSRAVDSGSRARARSSSSRGLMALAGVLAVVAVAEGVMLVKREAAVVDERTLRFPFTTSDSQRFVPTTPAIPFAVSPDGGTVVYAGTAPGARQLYVRTLADGQTRPLPGSFGNALNPIFSPDGRTISFVIDGRIVRTPVEGGPITTILNLDGRANAGSQWVTPDTIIASIGGVITAVPVNGGAIVRLSAPDTSRSELLQWGPRVISDRFIAYVTVGAGGMSANKLSILDRKTGRTILTDQSGTTVLGGVDGRVIWVTYRGAVMTATLDGDGKLGSPQLVLEDVLVRPGGAAKAALSAGGSLIYHHGTSESRLVLVDEKGAISPIDVPARAYSHPRWSPDGTRIAISIARAGGSDVWIIEPRSKSFRRLTSGQATADQPEWSADGKRILFRWQSATTTTTRAMAADGTGSMEILIDSTTSPYSASWSRDGRWVVASATNTAARDGEADLGADLGVVELSGARVHRVVEPIIGHQYTPQFSPDGRYLLYGSAQSGRMDIFVRPFPGTGNAIQVSGEGGAEALWSRDGRTIFYRWQRNVFAAQFTPGSPPQVGTPRILFNADLLVDTGYGQWDVSADGKHFLMLQNVDRQEEAVFIHNWAAELRKLWK